MKCKWCGKEVPNSLTAVLIHARNCPEQPISDEEGALTMDDIKKVINALKGNENTKRH